MSENTATSLRDIILNITKPHIIKDFTPVKAWQCFQVPIEKWTSLLDRPSAELVFQTGNRISANSPQWEYARTAITMKASGFYSKYKYNDKATKCWASYGYKSINILPRACTDGISFADFGFKDIESEDITFWLGSKDAHTPCHYDTYGCNIVVQVYGRYMG